MMAEEITTTSASVLTTVQKFEASNFVFKTPLNTSPRLVHISRDYYGDERPIAEIIHLEESSDSPPSSPTEPPALPTTDPPESTEESEEAEVGKVQKKSKKKASKSKVAKQKKQQPDLPKQKSSPAKQSKGTSPEQLPSSPGRSPYLIQSSPGKGPSVLQSSPVKGSNSNGNSPGKNPLNQPSPGRSPNLSQMSPEPTLPTSPTKTQSNVSLVPRKSSLKKPKNKAKLETKGLWFNMNDQYPVENFSGRQTIIEQIHQVVHGQKSRDVRPISRAIVLTGKPSMGKTEIARKFAFKFYVDCNGKGNVIWMDGSSKESITEALLLLEQKELLPIAQLYPDPGSVLDLETEDKLPSISKSEKKGKKKSDPETELQEKIASILRNRIFQDNPTLFIYDNARTEEDIIEFIPKLAPFGHIPNVLVTSGNENNWNNARVLKVGEFEFKDAVEFLLKIFEDCQGFTKFQAEDLAKELHRFPPLIQKARKIVHRYLLTHGDSDRAILRLEKNIGLVRRLKGEEIIETKEVEIAILGTDRGIYFDEDPYIREYDGELRNHQISMQVHQLEAVLSKVLERNDLSILAVNQDAYVLGMLSFMNRSSVYCNEQN
ncbi:unnamed protein product [Allacma fusca]|uniref:Uncharacterized protein n=2 Tax=Allacma fusca TaxID=39272 RepID=A0A8J2K6H6_9HEXA|nr:unnamed protein product [Allacma fusca]